MPILDNNDLEAISAKIAENVAGDELGWDLALEHIAAYVVQRMNNNPPAVGLTANDALKILDF